MAVTDANKMWSNHDFDVTQENAFNKTARINQAWQIVVDAGTTELEISNSGLLPATGSIFSTELPHMFLKNRSFDQVSPVFWIGMMSYEGEIGLNGAPWLNPPEISWTDTSSQEPVDMDWNGDPIVTVNGEAIRGVTVEVADLVLNVSRNYQSFSPAATFQYRHSVNSDTFASFSPGTGRLTRFSANQLWDANSGGYWKVNASVQFRYPFQTSFEKAWYARVRHEGLYEKRAGRIVRAVDKNEEPSAKPVLLKADGTRQEDPENAHYLEFQLYNKLPYNALGLL